MNKQLKILIGGAALSFVILLIGLGISKHLTTRLAYLESACIEGGKKDVMEAKSKGKWAAPSFDLICDPKELTDLQNLVGVQKEIAIVYHTRASLQKGITPLIFLMLTIALLPWFWYFMLTRIKELREAIIGK